MSEENQNQHPNLTPEQSDPNYKETLLLYNEKNGAVEAVSDLKQSGNQYKVTTTQPLTANKPAFYELRTVPQSRPSSRASCRRKTPSRFIF